MTVPATKPQDRIELRPATPDDVPAVTSTFLGCWRESYARVLPPGLVASMSDERATAMWTRVLTEAAPGDVVVATDAERDGLVVGVTRFVVLDDGSGMVHSLYVSPLAQGLGAGALLLRHAAQELRARGAALARLWVFRDNAPSIGFYAHQGWLPDGVSRVQDEFGEPELRLEHRLTP